MDQYVIFRIKGGETPSMSGPLNGKMSFIFLSVFGPSWHDFYHIDFFNITERLPFYGLEVLVTKEIMIKSRDVNPLFLRVMIEFFRCLGYEMVKSDCV